MPWKTDTFGYANVCVICVCLCAGWVWGGRVGVSWLRNALVVAYYIVQRGNVCWRYSRASSSEKGNCHCLSLFFASCSDPKWRVFIIALLPSSRPITHIRLMHNILEYEGVCILYKVLEMRRKNIIWFLINPIQFIMLENKN